MTPSDPLGRFQRLLAAAGGEPPALPAADCLDDAVIAALADGGLAPAARATVLMHLSRCPRCRGAVASVARALADADVSREVARAERTRPRRLRSLAAVVVPLAAAAIVVLVVRPRAPHQVAFLHRAPTLTAAPAPVPVSPVGAVADARLLVWTTTVGADRYRVTVFDSAGAVLFETESVDTATLLPDSVRLVAGRRYLWKVEARTDIGRWTASDLVDFSVPAGPAQ